MTTVLLLAADPTTEARLRLGEEFREIQQRLKASKHRDEIRLEQCLSVRPVDVSQSLLDIQPHIVHFSGHGTKSGALCLETLTGDTQPVSAAALGDLFRQFTEHVSCVVLNACYSEQQAQVIAQHIPYVIGMSDAIADAAAVQFSTGFYQAIGAGRTVEEAFELGCSQIHMHGAPDHLTPVLHRSSPATLLRSAIGNKRLVQFQYQGRLRVGEPHVFGSYKGKRQVLLYQTGGHSRRGYLPDWRRMDVDGIEELKILSTSFPGRRPALSGEHSLWETVTTMVQ